MPEADAGTGSFLEGQSFRQPLKSLGEAILPPPNVIRLQLGL